MLSIASYVDNTFTLWLDSLPSKRIFGLVVPRLEFRDRALETFSPSIRVSQKKAISKILEQ